MCKPSDDNNATREITESVNYNLQTIAAMQEADHIARDTSTPSFSNMQELINALNDD